MKADLGMLKANWCVVLSYFSLAKLDFFLGGEERTHLCDSNILLFQ